MSGANRNHVKLLTERRDFLRGKLAHGAGSPGSLQYAAAECKALDWAIEVLADLVERQRAEARDPSKQRERSYEVNNHAAAILAVLECGDQDTYHVLMERAPKRVRDQVDLRRFGSVVPAAAP